MKITLLTRDHGFVRDGEIPPFSPAPEVITWGSRVFVHDETANIEDPETVVYVEGLSYPLEVADKPHADVWTAQDRQRALEQPEDLDE